MKQTLSFDRGWSFHLGDVPFPVICGHAASYNNAKAGTAGGVAANDFDDSDWRRLDLPHDWAVEQPVDSAANVSQGFRARGIAWYRRSFRIDPAQRGKHLEIGFDGVSTHCTVWVNGLVAARNWCGYTSFQIDLTPFARYGDDLNTIAVRVDADAQEGWWYEGAGIYRHTWLVIRNPVHIVTDGVFAQPVRDDAGRWTIPAQITLNNSGKTTERAKVELSLIDPEGQVVATFPTVGMTLEALQTATAQTTLAVTSPRLWSIDTPTLYTVRAAVSLLAADGPHVSDQFDIHVGFRSFRFDAKTGFYLNDQPLKIKGTCNHQDHAGVGVAVPDSLWEYRIRRLKEMGSNAYRCAHNPPSSEFLDACDRLGMLVMDENRNFNTTDEYVRQLQWLIRRDRNHPSVILWSVFNEEPFQATEQGYEMVRRLTAVVKQLDTTRPVTVAQSGGHLNAVNAALAADVVGFNYQHDSYDPFHREHPHRPALSSEDASAVMTRDEYETDHKQRHIIDSYDDQWQPWGLSQRRSWREIDTRPYLAGGFVWTGFDYRGEPQPLDWPATGSSFGCIDQCGFPKNAYFIRQAMWIKDRPILHLIPHWNWSGREGQPIKVMAISNANEIELFINGRSLGRKASDPYDMVSWQVPYEPGKLEAVSYNGGVKQANFSVETTGPAVALEVVPDRASLDGDGCDAQPVTIRAVDAQGRIVPTSHPLATFTLTGPGEILGVGNGDPICHELEKANVRTLFHGLASVIVRSSQQGQGPLTLTASAEGLGAGSATIIVRPASSPASVEPASKVFLVRGWRRSPATEAPPAQVNAISNTDMNTWLSVDAGRPEHFTGGRFVVFRTIVRLPALVRRQGGVITFKQITGKATVWLDGKTVATKNDYEPGELRVNIEPGDSDRTFVVLVESTKDATAGLTGVVECR
jgi:beta-galactosidase